MTGRPGGILVIAPASAGCECLFGAWLSLVERLVRDQEVRSSNLRAPTKSLRVFFLVFSSIGSVGRNVSVLDAGRECPHLDCDNTTFAQSDGALQMPSTVGDPEATRHVARFQDAVGGFDHVPAG